MGITWLKPLKSARGFSLIEMMTVVAIIGIMAAIAVPNFQRFQRQSQQNEAKAALAQIFSAEKVFYADQAFYTCCIWQIGYQPSPGSTRNYLTGAYNACLATNWTTDKSNAGSSCSGSVNPFGTSNRNDATIYANNKTPYPAVSGAWGVTDDTHYTMTALGDLNGPVIDVWQIDQDDNLSNVQSGL